MKKRNEYFLLPFCIFRKRKTNRRGLSWVSLVTIHDNAKVGANAVVLCDVPENCIAVGVPAVIKNCKV